MFKSGKKRGLESGFEDEKFGIKNDKWGNDLTDRIKSKMTTTTVMFVTVTCRFCWYHWSGEAGYFSHWTEAKTFSSILCYASCLHTIKVVNYG